MSFRRRRAKTADWLDWLYLHRDELAACGLPPPVLSSQLRWHVFLDHEACDEVHWDKCPDWAVRWLSPAQARTLADLIRREYGDAYPGILRVLAEVAGAGNE